MVHIGLADTSQILTSSLGNTDGYWTNVIATSVSRKYNTKRK